MKVIVVSAVNLRSGGPLSVLNDCLRVLNDEFSVSYKIIALVHKKELFDRYKNIQFIDFPKSAKSYFYRMYLEYFYFKRISKKVLPYLWFSLHDITPNVIAERRAVYCHNPSPFYRFSLREFLLDPSFFLMSIFYQFFYSKNIHENDHVVVQQDWLREEFKRRFHVDNVLVAYPSLDSVSSMASDVSLDIKSGIQDKFVFFYPAFPRVFKNIDFLCEAASILQSNGFFDFELWLTIDGSENKYSKFIVDKYSDIECIKFKGLQSRESVFEMYGLSDALLFPSKLETWGLPITEFKISNKPMLIADLPYAHETVGDYQNVTFFPLSDAGALASIMQDLVSNSFLPQGNLSRKPNGPYVSSWKELFDFMLEVK